jgi:poly(A) polymerase
LLVRYSAGQDGGLKKKALVYQLAEHGIPRSAIAPEAVKIIERLKASGHQAYIVGGAVRDLLVGKTPKDFDIVTDATPGRIKKLFWNARIIGRRFRLVHIFFDKRIYEVATFRSLKDGSVGNDYGSMDEDVQRRDFTMNALYYDPKEETLVDYVGGLGDIRRRIIRPLIPMRRIFREDPVRMLRAAKYAAGSGFRIPLGLAASIRAQSRLLAGASVSRLSEELSKILASGRARGIFDNLIRLKLLGYILPEAAERCRSPAFRRSFLEALGRLDAEASREAEARLGDRLSYLLDILIGDAVDWSQDPVEVYPAAVQAAREALSPMNLPRLEIECAVRYVFRRRGIPLMQSHLRPRDEEEGGGRRRHGGRRGGAQGQAGRKGGGFKAERTQGDRYQGGRPRQRPEGGQGPAGDSGGAASRGVQP